MFTFVFYRNLDVVHRTGWFEEDILPLFKKNSLDESGQTLILCDLTELIKELG